MTPLPEELLREARRDGNLVYTTMHDRWHRGKEIRRNRIALRFEFDASVPETEREQLIAAVAAILTDADGLVEPEKRIRLNHLKRMEVFWREVAETGPAGNEPLPQALDALAEAIRIAKAERKRADIAADLITAQAAELAELREQVKAKDEALERVLHWAEAQCPCHNEEPNPCPLCGASVENLEACKSAENTLPRDILVLLRTTAARKGGNRRTS